MRQKKVAIIAAAIIAAAIVITAVAMAGCSGSSSAPPTVDTADLQIQIFVAGAGPTAVRHAECTVTVGKEEEVVVLYEEGGCMVGEIQDLPTGEATLLFYLETTSMHGDFEAEYTTRLKPGENRYTNDIKPGGG